MSTGYIKRINQLHLAMESKSAGFGTGRHIKKIMSDEEYQAYTRQMAFLGYLTALDSAERLNSKTVDSLNFIIRPIVERLVEVKNILKELLGIKDEKDEKSDLQKKLTGLIV